MSIIEALLASRLSGMQPGRRRPGKSWSPEQVLLHQVSTTV